MLLIDDLGGRKEAARRILNVAGTLTVLYLGAGRGLVEDFPGTLKRNRLPCFDRNNPALFGPSRRTQEISTHTPIRVPCTFTSATEKA